MNFKEWLLQNEIATDSWGTPTAEPVARIYANYYGSAINGVLLPDSLPVDHGAQDKARKALERKYKKMKNKHKRRLRKKHAKLMARYKDSDTPQNMHRALEKRYQKRRRKLPRPTSYDDAPDQFTTAGWDSVGEPDPNYSGFQNWSTPIPEYR